MCSCLDLSRKLPEGSELTQGGEPTRKVLPRGLLHKSRGDHPCLCSHLGTYLMFGKDQRVFEMFNWGVSYHHSGTCMYGNRVYGIATESV